mgnify:CR=1 FL=1
MHAGIASEYSVKCSYLELYNEEITDLLMVGADVPKVCVEQGLERSNPWGLHGGQAAGVCTKTCLWPWLARPHPALLFLSTCLPSTPPARCASWRTAAVWCWRALRSPS